MVSKICATTFNELLQFLLLSCLSFFFVLGAQITFFLQHICILLKCCCQPNYISSDIPVYFDGILVKNLSNLGQITLVIIFPYILVRSPPEVQKTSFYHRLSWLHAQYFPNFWHFSICHTLLFGLSIKIRKMKASSFPILNQDLLLVFLSECCQKIHA